MHRTMTYRAGLAVLLCFSTGCTLIGAGSGAVIDAAIPGPYDTLGVEQSGKGWLYGGLIGLAVDATLVVVATVALNNMSMRGLKLGGESGCFC